MDNHLEDIQPAVVAHCRRKTPVDNCWVGNRQGAEEGIHQEDSRILAAEDMLLAVADNPTVADNRIAGIRPVDNLRVGSRQEGILRADILQEGILPAADTRLVGIQSLAVDDWPADAVVV